jgi:hypothetical protein
MLFDYNIYFIFYFTYIYILCFKNRILYQEKTQFKIFHNMVLIEKYIQTALSLIL